MIKQPCVYILTNKRNGTLYTGVTSNLSQRIDQHQNGGSGSFTDRYKLKRLMYVEACETMEAAILREKKIKGGSRKKKIVLIEAENPLWEDLSQSD